MCKIDYESMNESVDRRKKQTADSFQTFQSKMCSGNYGKTT